GPPPRPLRLGLGRGFRGRLRGSAPLRLRDRGRLLQEWQAGNSEGLGQGHSGAAKALWHSVRDGAPDQIRRVITLGELSRSPVEETAAAAWAHCVAVPAGIVCQDEAGQLWDVLWSAIR